MSLLSRFLGIGSNDDRGEPRSVQRIVEKLEGLEPERARFLAAFAYVLARVAHADMEIDATEIAEMQRSVTSQGELDPGEAKLVTDIALSQAGTVGGTDDYLVTREFRSLSERSDRVRLMRCLLAVAAADDSITSPETREITSIGEELGFRRSEINALRLEWRDQLAELKQLPIEK